MGFDLPDDIQIRLNAAARKAGKTVDLVVAELIADQFERMDQERAEVIEAIRLADRGTAEGRSRPAAEFFAEMKAKYNIPDNVAPLTHEEALLLS